MPENSKKRSSIITIISVILFIATAFGWVYTSGQSSKDKTLMQGDISTLQTKVGSLITKQGEIDKEVGIVSSNLVLLLTHFGIEPATGEEEN